DQRVTHSTRARKLGSQSGLTPRSRRLRARRRPWAGTSTVTRCPRPARRSAYVRMARTPPAILTCGQRNVIRTSVAVRSRSALGARGKPATVREAGPTRCAASRNEHHEARGRSLPTLPQLYVRIGGAVRSRSAIGARGEPAWNRERSEATLLDAAH